MRAYGEIIFFKTDGDVAKLFVNNGVVYEFYTLFADLKTIVGGFDLQFALLQTMVTEFYLLFAIILITFGASWRVFVACN